MKTIQNVAKGLDIISKYSNDITIDGRIIIAGPIRESVIKEQHQKELLDMGWMFEEGIGWSYWV
jgi:hypothetical protein